MAIEKRGALPLLRARGLAAGLRAGVVAFRAGGVAGLAFAAVLLPAALGVGEVFGVRVGISLALLVAIWLVTGSYVSA
jgi:hypothetical protein